ncbi:MAG: hypothetical protein Q4C87_11345 [Actinomycetaceae bacterium]|nr:hypothetical protein [Actinomycetaceae bacterium]
MGVLIILTILIALISAADLAWKIRRLRLWVRAGAPPHVDNQVLGGTGGRRDNATGVGAGGARGGLFGWFHGKRRAPPSSTVLDAADLSLVVSEVAARLRSGMPVEHAWQATWERGGQRPPLGEVGVDGVPEIIHLLARDGPLLLSFRGGGVGHAIGGAAPSVIDHLRRLAPATFADQARARAARTLIAAFRFTQGLGAPLAEVLDAIADGIDEAEAAQSAQQVATAGPRTSARMLTLMPLVGILGAEILGARPVERFMDGSIGTLAFLVGVGCMACAHLVSRHLLHKLHLTLNTGRSSTGLDPTIVCELAIAGMGSGASIPATIEELGRCADMPDLVRIGREVRLGVSWYRAWDEAPPGTDILCRALEPAWVDGASPVPLLRRAVNQVRSRRGARAKEAAEELGVRLVAPLGALLLPAFIALGVVPVILYLVEGGVGLL